VFVMLWVEVELMAGFVDSTRLGEVSSRKK